MPEPGIYLVNATGELIPLATESGGGDTELLKETLSEHSDVYPWWDNLDDGEDTDD